MRIVALASSSTGGLVVSGSGVTATLDDVVIDDDDPSGDNNAYGMVITAGATAEISDSRIVGLCQALRVGSGTATGTVTVRSSYLDASAASVTANAGTATIDNSVLTEQISLGTAPYTEDVDVTVRNSTFWRVHYSGSSSTGTRAITVENSTLSGSVEAGAGDGNTEATILNSALSGAVDADTETCVGVAETSLPFFSTTTCP